MKEIYDDKNWELITKYIGNELNDEEREEMNRWLQENPDHQKELEHAQTIWELSAQKDIHTFNTNDGWNKLKKRQSPTSTFKRISNKQILITFSKIAASLIFLMVLAFTARYFINKTNNTEIVAKVKMIEKPVVLPDGTTVYLNAGASLIYPKKFGTTTRRIELSGEAFFNVTRNEKVPFIINTRQAQIKVLGTSFNVIAEKCSDNIQVVVESGLVELQSPLNEEKILISKGNTGSFLTGANKYQLSSSDINSLAWMTNRIQFKESGLLYVTQTLERLFKKKINLGNENLKKCKVSADFKNQSLEKILDAIKESLKVEIKSTKQGYVLTGSGC